MTGLPGGPDRPGTRAVRRSHAPLPRRRARSSARRDRRGQGGYLTVEVLVAVGVSLLVLVLVVNLLLLAYARGAVRTALDEGARAGARDPDPVLACQARASATLDGLLGGSLRAGVGTPGCMVEGEHLVAEAEGAVAGWLPLVPTWSVDERARSRLTVPSDEPAR